MLQSEVNRLEDLLAATRAERDEIGSKYMAVSDKVNETLECGIFVNFYRVVISLVFESLSPSEFEFHFLLYSSFHCH